eukprot:561546-Pyramimonas_sp.AAC.1
MGGLSYIPSRVLGVRPVRLLDYLRAVRPPTGGYIPVGRAPGERTLPIGFCQARSSNSSVALSAVVGLGCLHFLSSGLLTSLECDFPTPKPSLTVHGSPS